MNLLTTSRPPFPRTSLALAVCLALAGGVSCGKSDTGGPAPTPTVPAYEAPGGAGGVDILFMIDNSSSMVTMQQKLLAQIPMFLDTLQTATRPLSDFHIAVVSSDLGAAGDSTSSIGCTSTGDSGIFQFQPRGDCSNAALEQGATYISNVGGVANYTGQLTDVLACITPLGATGCGFEHQLASIVRALGADGQPAPDANAGFLRQDAELAIFLLTNEDDCSAPADTTLFSLNGYSQNLSNPLGPVANYRCNQFGHLCRDRGGAHPSALLPPPLNPPSDAQGSDAPTLNLVDCESNDSSSGMLTPVSTFVAQIKALKADPSKITVGALVAPAAPYTVAWQPATGGSPGSSGQLWPEVQHSCGAQGSVNPLSTDVTTDNSFGDPGVRITQWVQAFGDNGVLGSICDDYAPAMGSMATKVLANRGAAPDGGTD